MAKVNALTALRIADDIMDRIDRMLEPAAKGTLEGIGNDAAFRVPFTPGDLAAYWTHRKAYLEVRRQVVYESSATAPRTDPEPATADDKPAEVPHSSAAQESSAGSPPSASGESAPTAPDPGLPQSPSSSPPSLGHSPTKEQADRTAKEGEG